MITYDSYLIHLYTHSDDVQDCPWCGPWGIIAGVTLTGRK